MTTIHIWETNFTNYTVEAAAGSTYQYVLPAHPGFHVSSVKLGNSTLSSPYKFTVPQSYIDLTVYFEPDIVPPIPPIQPSPKPGQTIPPYVPPPLPPPTESEFVGLHDCGNNLTKEFNYYKNTSTKQLFNTLEEAAQSAVDQGCLPQYGAGNIILIPSMEKMRIARQSSVNDLSKALNDLIGTVQSGFDELRGKLDAVDGIWDKLEGWLIERILGILEKALDAEVEK